MEKYLNLSVIMSNYNHGKFLSESIGSVLGQLDFVKEFIIVDDASTDASVDIIMEYASKEPKIRFIKNEQNKGILYNLNKLIDLASSEYIFGLAADDRIMDGFFKKCLDLLCSNPTAGLCYSKCSIIDESGRNKGVYTYPKLSMTPAFIAPQKIRRHFEKNGEPWVIGTPVIYRKQALLDIGGFAPELGPYCDSFANQLISLRYGACFVPETLGCLRVMQTGYLATSYSDVAKSILVARNAHHLMSTVHQNIFPSSFVTKCSNAMLYSAGNSLALKYSKHYIEYLNEIRQVIANPTFFDRLAWSLFARMIVSLFFIVRIYLFIRLGPVSVRAIYRRLIKILQSNWNMLTGRA